MTASFPRHLYPICQELLSDAPIMVIQGARQVGKSTLAQQLAGEKSIVVTLDDAGQREFAQADPARFLQQANGHTLVIDELQRVPELTLQLKAAVDQDRRPGRFIITGSANLLKTRGSGDSLAGRQESVTLRPLSVGEQLSLPPEDFVSWVLAGAQGDFTAQDPAPFVLRGGYPVPLLRTSERTKRSWFTNYVDALATHDAAEIEEGDFSAHLRNLMSYLATHGAHELVKRRIAQHLGTSETTVNKYIGLLQRMYLLEEAPAWGLNYGSRVIRRPKVGLVDTGLAASLTGFTIDKISTVGGREHYGSLLEQFVTNELLKQQEWSDTAFRVHHFRERNQEVDLVLELNDGRLILLEVKSRSVAGVRQAEHLQAMKERLGDRVAAAAVLYTGELAFSPEPWLHVLPISALWAHPRVETHYPGQDF